MQHDSAATTFLFTDIEGSTRLWEREPDRMRPALARHDAIARASVEAHGGRVVKMTGDGLHAAFSDPLDALHATLALQRELREAELDIALAVRCGLHAGTSESRDSDFYGSVVNRAARVMSAAHGGQMLVSRAVEERIRDRLPKGVALRDLGDVRLRDLASPERIFQVVSPGLRADFPALRSLEQTPNNLPHALTAFIGRERELAEARRLLGMHRLVTIVGMGGIGKSRLALQIAAEAVEDHPDGTWLVELGALSDPRRVTRQVASVLGVLEDSGRDPRERLVRYLKDRRLLLILDNCEHVLAASAELSRALLMASGGLRVVATSREPLQIGGEAVLPVTPLSVPGPLAVGEPDAALRYDSVRLFIERASTASPSFRFGAANAAAISAVCHRLEGIPLAIELAAARIRTLPVEQIALRLKDRLRSLASADPTASPRQRTLYALIDWSHELLAEDERALFRRLAAFGGGWTLEAAEQACGFAPIEAGAVADVLARLVEKSLVVMDAETGRFRMLETVRDFALARLQACDDLGATESRHFDFFLGLAQRARAAITGPEQAAWLAILDSELENILAAHRWVDRASGRDAEGLKLASLMKFYWITRGLLELGEGTVLAALERPGAAARDEARCRALFDAGQINYFMARHPTAWPLLQESLAIARELNDSKKVSAVLQPLGMTALALGDRATARECLDEALAIAEAADDERGIATAANVLGQLYRIEGSSAQATAMFERTVALSRKNDDPAMIAVGLLNLAMTCLPLDGGAFSCAAAAEALEIAEGLRSQPLAMSALDVASGIAASRGEHARAARLYGAAVAYGERSGLGRDPADEAFISPLVRGCALALGDEDYSRHVAEGQALGPEEAAAEARKAFGAAER